MYFIPPPPGGQEVHKIVVVDRVVRLLLVVPRFVPRIIKSPTMDLSGRFVDPFAQGRGVCVCKQKLHSLNTLERREPLNPAALEQEGAAIAGSSAPGSGGQVAFYLPS